MDSQLLMGAFYGCGRSVKIKIIIPTIGSRGDVQPFIALAQARASAGHTVTLASDPVMFPSRSYEETEFFLYTDIFDIVNLCRSR